MTSFRRLMMRYLETQKLHSRIIFLSSGGPAEGSRGWPGSTNRDLEGPGSRPRGSGNQSGRPADHAKSSSEWPARDLVDGQRTEAEVDSLPSFYVKTKGIGDMSSIFLGI